MLVDPAILRFCATKTREIVARYVEACPGEAETYPRSYSDLYWIISEHCGKPIHVKQLNTISAKDSHVLGMYQRLKDKFMIFLVSGLRDDMIFFTKCKELFQVYLDIELYRTVDIIDLIQNMILRSSPASVQLDLGHATVSEMLAEVAALEFLFPYKCRVEAKKPSNGGAKQLEALARKHGIPGYLIDRMLADGVMTVLKPYFGTEPTPKA